MYFVYCPEFGRESTTIIGCFTSRKEVESIVQKIISESKYKSWKQYNNDEWHIKLGKKNCHHWLRLEIHEESIGLNDIFHKYCRKDLGL